MKNSIRRRGRRHDDDNDEEDSQKSAGNRKQQIGRSRAERGMGWDRRYDGDRFR